MKALVMTGTHVVCLLMARLKGIANAETIEEYNSRLQTLQKSEEWLQDEAFQRWFSNTWIQHHEVRYN